MHAFQIVSEKMYWVRVVEGRGMPSNPLSVSSSVTIMTTIASSRSPAARTVGGTIPQAHRNSNDGYFLNSFMVLAL